MKKSPISEINPQHHHPFVLLPNARATNEWSHLVLDVLGRKRNGVENNTILVRRRRVVSHLAAKRPPHVVAHSAGGPVVGVRLALGLVVDEPGAVEAAALPEDVARLEDLVLGARVGAPDVYCDGQLLLAVRWSGVGTAVGRGTYVAHGKGSVEILGPLDAEAGNFVVHAPVDHALGDYVAADLVLLDGIAAEAAVGGQRDEVSRGEVGRVGDDGAGEGEGAGHQAGQGHHGSGQETHGDGRDCGL